MVDLDHYEDYLRIKRRSENTINNYLSDVNNYIKWLVSRNSKEPLEKGLKHYISYLSLDRKLSASTINRNMASLSNYFDYLVYEEKISTNPMDKIRLQIGTFKDEKDNSVDYLKADELKTLFNSIDGTYEKRNRAIVAAMALGGLRVSEVSNLNTTDIKERDGQNFFDIVGKGNKRRIIPISNSLELILKDYMEVRPNTSSRALFISNKGGNRLGVGGIQDMINVISKKTGISLHPHTLRHTALTYLYDATKDLTVVQEIAGHSNINTTRIYVHVLDEKPQKAMELSVLNGIIS